MKRTALILPLTKFRKSINSLVALKGQAMNIQYIKDDRGKGAGVFIPIEEWKDPLERLPKVKSEEATVEDWHQSVVNGRTEEYRKNPSKTYDAEETLGKIEDDLCIKLGSS